MISQESGPDGVGAMGGEDAIDLVVIPLSPEAAEASGTASPLTPPRHSWHLMCGSGRLISAEDGARGVLGLCDDVDCAVVSVQWTRPTTPRMGTPTPPSVTHECYVPALAYITAGKIHKKHLLIGGTMIVSD